MSLITLRLAIAALGVAVWAYGHYARLDSVRLVGMFLLVVSLLLRFAHPRPRRGEPPDA